MTINRMMLVMVGLVAGCGALSAQYSPYQQSQPYQQAQTVAPTFPNPGAPTPVPGGTPAQPYAFPYHPQPGVAETPWCGGQPAGGNLVGGCNGPVGDDGPITYETYLRTGPNILAGANAFTGALNTGWTVQGGGRSLFFNTSRDAAWVLDVGLGYTRNEGNGLDSPVNIAPSSLKFGTVGDDTPRPFGVRFLNRTSLNYGLGRDWFLNGPGAIGEETFGNWRFGIDVGGRYGTASVGFQPTADPEGSRRRQGIFHGVYVGSGMTWEKPFGATSLYGGLRAEWGYEWTNLLPPNNADISDVNLLMQFGIRF